MKPKLPVGNVIVYSPVTSGSAVAESTLATVRPMRTRAGLCIAAALVVASCSGSGNDAADTTQPPLATAADSAITGDSVAATDVPASTTTVPAQPTTTELASTPADAATVAAIEDALASAPDGCDPLDTRQCVLPFPSNAFLVDDPSTPSGHRVAFPAAALPTNAQGVTVDPARWNSRGRLQRQRVAAHLRGRSRPDEPADVDRPRCVARRRCDRRARRHLDG